LPGLGIEKPQGRRAELRLVAVREGGKKRGREGFF
jgi:hypothetical protein